MSGWNGAGLAVPPTLLALADDVTSRKSRNVVRSVFYPKLASNQPRSSAANDVSTVAEMVSPIRLNRITVARSGER